MSGSAVRLAGTSIERDGVPIVVDIDLDIQRGDWLGLIGPNGAGKSTLLEGIAGLIPTVGRISVLDVGADEMSARERARRIAVVPQHPVLPPGMPVIDYVMLGRAPHSGRLGVETYADVLAANAALDDLDLVQFAQRPVDALSGGERQRVVIARALAQAAPILLLDEPTTALDVGVQMEVLDHIDRIRASSNLTVVSAIHDLTVAAQYCDRLVMISRGRVVADGSAERVLTPESINRHYGATVKVMADSDGGVIVIPVRNKPGTRAVPPELSQTTRGHHV